MRTLRAWNKFFTNTHPVFDPLKTVSSAYSGDVRDSAQELIAAADSLLAALPLSETALYAHLQASGVAIGDIGTVARYLNKIIKAAEKITRRQ
jgi:hypothetical protein